MNLYADPLSVRAEINRRFELAGVDPEHLHDGLRHEAPVHRAGGHPVAALVARLVGGSSTPRPASRSGAPVASGRPRHP